ncbi:MAG TPA: hypothetical protein VF727_17285 [Allosphingosinicella sp.]|jgi:ribose/xylose/arabinose/galactoside ABC-type transport system permease subunit
MAAGAPRLRSLLNAFSAASLAALLVAAAATVHVIATDPVIAAQDVLALASMIFPIAALLLLAGIVPVFVMGLAVTAAARGRAPLWLYAAAGTGAGAGLAAVLALPFGLPLRDFVPLVGFLAVALLILGWLERRESRAGKA